MSSASTLTCDFCGSLNSSHSSVHRFDGLTVSAGSPPRDTLPADRIAVHDLVGSTLVVGRTHPLVAVVDMALAPEYKLARGTLLSRIEGLDADQMYLSCFAGAKDLAAAADYVAHIPCLLS